MSLKQITTIKKLLFAVDIDCALSVIGRYDVLSSTT